MLVLAGRLAHASSRTLDEQISRLLGTGNARLVIDFAAVDYVSSGGLEVVGRAAAAAAAAGGTLVISGLSDSVRMVFELSGMLPAVATEESREAAIERARR